MDPTTIRVTLPTDLLEELGKKPMGSGGYQSLMVDLRRHLKGAELEIDRELRERIEHYAYDFGSGGWQDFLRALLERIELAERPS